LAIESFFPSLLPSYKERSGEHLADLLLVGVLIPVIEEFLFRSWLRFRPLYIVIGVSVIGASIFCLLFGTAKVGLTLVALLLLSGSVLSFSVNWRRVYKFYIKYYPIIFYMSSLIFGLVHFVNFESFQLSNVIFLMPIILGGINLSIVRVHLGLKRSALLHILHNLILLIVSYSVIY
jgi:hypothetical protein